MRPIEAACSVPPALSRVPRKRELYAVDPYFRDAWDELRGAAGTGPATLERLGQVASLVLRPDTWAVRGGAAVLSAVRARGFVPLACEILRFDRLTTRELWRYQLNIATRERIDVMDMIMPAGDSLYLLLRGPADSDVPATSRMSELKGPSRPEDREPQHLRRIAGPAQASVLTYLHAPDEPADLVRELGLFFDRPRRARLIAALEERQDASVLVLAAIGEIEAQIEPSDLCWRAALDRLRVLLAGRADGEELGHLLHQVESGLSRDWRSVLSLADQLGLPWAHWDRVAVGAELSARHLDSTPVIPDVGPAAWHPATGAPDRVTVARLAAAKRLPIDALRHFGLTDCEAGVRFAYAAADGSAGRTRLRTGMRGAGGSAWLPGDEAPVVAYSTRAGLEQAVARGYQIVVEGESDCWTAWQHGLPAVGIPGSEHWDALSLEHLPVAEVFVQVEAGSAQTYPGGVPAYVRAVVRRIREVGFTGTVHELRLGGGVSDLSELHQSDPATFASAVAAALARSRRASRARPA